MRRTMLTATLAATAVVAGVLAGGCNNSSTEPNRTIALTGTIPKGGTVIEQVSMRHVGNLRMQLTDLQLVAADGTILPSFSGVTVGLGAGGSETCTATGNFGLLLGATPLSLGLQRGAYCLRMSEGLALADGTSLKYNIKVEISD